jgi:arginyl-tRNA--protein-N-Asp/Glu arginylyltransferase
MNEYLLNNGKTKNSDNNKTNNSNKDNLLQNQNKASTKTDQINNPKKQIKEDKDKKENNENRQKYVFDYFPEIVPDPEIYLPLKHTYSLEITNNIILTENEERFLLYKKYQETVHKEKNLPLSDHNDYWGNSILEEEKKYQFLQT